MGRTREGCASVVSLMRCFRVVPAASWLCQRCVSYTLLPRPAVLPALPPPLTPTHRPPCCSIVRCRSLEEETEPDSCRGEALRGALAAEDTAANAALYLLLRAADRFHATYQRYPGTFDRWGSRGAGGGGLGAWAALLWRGRRQAACGAASPRRLAPCQTAARPLRCPLTRAVPALCPLQCCSELEEDAALLKSQANAILSECGAAGGGGGSSAPAGVSDDLVGEMCRCAAGELHVVAAVVGAIAAQEAIKLLTGQFVPVGGALIYNAMQCTTSVFAF